MKTIYLILSVLLTAAILVIAFTNINSGCSTLTVLNYPISANPALLLLSVAVLGILTGVFYHAFIAKLLDSED